MLFSRPLGPSFKQERCLNPTAMGLRRCRQLHTVYSMQKPALDARANLSDAAAEPVRAMITSGELAAGSRINEVQLAEQLGVSRTPLREALAALVSEGALEHRPRRGYFVRPLSSQEFSDLYAIRPLLDVEALRRAGIPTDSTIDRLSTLNDQLRRARGAQQRIRLDDEWHLLLVQGCGNAVLLDLIEQFMYRTRRYEIAYLREAAHLETAYEEHRVVEQALRRGDLHGACAGLTNNLTSGLAPVLAWLERMEASRD